MDLNQLRKYMDFYRSTGAGPHNTTHTGFNPTIFDEDGAALDWATNAMGGQGEQQNFFAPRPQPAYVQPREFTDTMPQRPQRSDPIRGQTMNYLATLMRGR